MQRARVWPVAGSVLFSLLCGCRANPFPLPTIPSLVGSSLAFAGRVRGGVQPVSHAGIGLSAAGAAGPGSAATSLLTSAVAVKIVDEMGRLCARSLAAVTFQASDAFSDISTKAAVAGVAAFANRSFAASGTYTLKASSGSLSPAHTAVTITSPPTAGEQAVSSEALADSVGMNLHLSYAATLYGTNFPLILSSLQDLRIHHVRDGLIDFGDGTNEYYTKYQQLAAQGIHADYITSVGQSEALMKAYPARVAGMEALEGPNEYDASGDPNWAAKLQAFLPLLSDAVHGSNPMTGVALIGPSLVNQSWYSGTGNSYVQLGTVRGMFDAGNLHNYPGGRNPGTAGWTPQGYGSISFAIAAARQSWPKTPLITTETGYWDDSSMNESIPDATIARYAPRLILEQYLQAITRTYLYELVDNQFSGGSYGLLHADGTPKPAYTALQQFMHLIADPGPAYAAQKLPWLLTGGNPDLHHLVLEKRDGTFLIALWVEEPSYDVNAKTPLPVTPETVSLEFASPMNLVAVHVWQDSGTVATTLKNQRLKDTTLQVSDVLTLLEVHS